MKAETEVDNKSVKELQCGNTHISFGHEALALFYEYCMQFKRIFFLADFRTLRKCLPHIESLFNDEKEYHTLVIQEGERFKNISTCVLLWKQLQELNAKRSDLFVNVGGGVVCDLGAFVAATYNRGMTFVNIPTSLMAMADAAIGGKVGVDLEHIKNQIGLITQPHDIYIYPPFLKTLDKRQLQSGMAEIIKHALIADASLWEDLLDGKDEPDDEMIFHSAKIKAEIASADMDEKGSRRILNFGHTVGHALESHSLLSGNSLLHGEAVAMGIVCETYLSTQHYGLSANHMKSIAQYIFNRYGKYVFNAEAIPSLIQLMLHDKKRDNAELNFSLISAPGKSGYNIYCTPEDVEKALKVYLDLRAK